MYSVIQFLGGKCPEHPEAAKTGESDRIRETVRSPEYPTGNPMEFVWNMYVGKTTIGILERVKDLMEETGTTTAQLQDRIIFMSMCNDTEYWKQNTQNECWNNAAQVAQYARGFKPVPWTFLWIGKREKGAWKLDKENRRRL